jgi:predicted GNAT family acetyltransferase
MPTRTASTRRVLLFIICAWSWPALAAAQTDEPGTQNGSCAAPLGALRVQGELQRVVHTIWHRSPTVRRQLARIASEGTLVITLGYCSNACPTGVAARTQISLENGVLRRATVEISIEGRGAAAELVAHELEHILEQLDGVDLRKLATSRRASDHGVREQNGSHYETERARQVGLRAAAEYHAHARPPFTCAVHP